MILTITNPDGFVLIGGASSRMGRQKPEMPVGGRRLFERAAAALSVVCSTSVTLVGQIDSDFDSDLPIIPDMGHDSTTHSRASIYGLYTALAFAKTEWIAILACDLPFVTKDLMARLGAYCSNEFDAVVPVQPDKRSQPLCAFYRRDKCLIFVEDMIRNDELKIQRLLHRVTTRFVEFDEIADLDRSANFFFNVNRPEDYETALEIALVSDSLLTEPHNR